MYKERARWTLTEATSIQTSVERTSCLLYGICCDKECDLFKQLVITADPFCVACDAKKHIIDPAEEPYLVYAVK